LSSVKARHEIGALDGGKTLNGGIRRLRLQIVAGSSGHRCDRTAVISTCTSNSDDCEKEEH
jgi:hypothetical protein